MYKKKKDIFKWHIKKRLPADVLCLISDGVNSQCYNMTAFLRYNPGLTTGLKLRKLAHKTHKTLDVDRAANIFTSEPSTQVLPNLHLYYLFIQT
jgi:hypothetical protein